MLSGKQTKSKNHTACKTHLPYYCAPGLVCEGWSLCLGLNTLQHIIIIPASSYNGQITNEGEREREETQSQTKLQWPGPVSQVWEGPTFSCIAWWMHGKKMENWGFLPVSFREIIHLTLCCNFHSFKALLDGIEHKHSPGQTSLAPITGWPRARGWALTLVIFQSLGGEYSEILWNSGLFLTINNSTTTDTDTNTDIFKNLKNFVEYKHCSNVIV